MALNFVKKKRKEKKQKSALREWFDALKFAVIVATLFKWSFLGAFSIPTPSMEGSLLVGDYLVVSKIHYGPRTPQTPLQVPLTHQTFPGSKAPSYLDWIQLPSVRIPGLSKVKHNDAVVFNYPPETVHPTDLKTYYVKRCVGLPGDILSIDNNQVYVNDKHLENPNQMQLSYLVKSDGPLAARIFKKCGIWDYLEAGNDTYYIKGATEASIKQLESLPFIASITPTHLTFEGFRSYGKGDLNPDIYPKSDKLDWNEDFYGPLRIPAKGQTITITPENVLRYSELITNFEGHENVFIKDTKLLIDQKEVTEYTFRQNYYFMMGDNRHNSLDSRFWGFVPEDHVVGKALWVLASFDQDESFPNSIRWHRLFKSVK
ncbi:MAG: signal peptidase I [Cyclobacteriaceae bacterium]